MTFPQALAVSLVLHVALAAVLIRGRLPAPALSKPPSLETGRIELSLVEEPRAAEPAVAAPAAESVFARPPRQRLPPAFEMPAMEVTAAPEVVPPEFAAAAEAVPDPPEPRARLSDGEGAAQPGPASRQARVDAPALPKQAIRPDYPRGARRRGEEGDVLLEVSVGADGGVVSVHVAASSGFPELDAAARAAVVRAVFTPATAAGRAIASVVRLPLRFRLK